MKNRIFTILIAFIALALFSCKNDSNPISAIGTFTNSHIELIISGISYKVQQENGIFLLNMDGKYQVFQRPNVTDSSAVGITRDTVIFTDYHSEYNIRGGTYCNAYYYSQCIIVLNQTKKIFETVTFNFKEEQHDYIRTGSQYGEDNGKKVMQIKLKNLNYNFEGKNLIVLLEGKENIKEHFAYFDHKYNLSSWRTYIDGSGSSSKYYTNYLPQYGLIYMENPFIKLSILKE